MPSKLHVTFLVAGIIHGVCYTAESFPVPGSTLSADLPAQWVRLPGDERTAVIHGPGRSTAAMPKIAIACTSADPAAAAAAIRDGLMRVGDGCEVIDADQIPLGGRVWQRIRLRFAAGPLEFGQSIWAGTVAGRTVTVVLSAPEEDLAAHLPAGAAVVASLRSAGP